MVAAKDTVLKILDKQKLKDFHHKRLVPKGMLKSVLQAKYKQKLTRQKVPQTNNKKRTPNHMKTLR